MVGRGFRDTSTDVVVTNVIVDRGGMIGRAGLASGSMSQLCFSRGVIMATTAKTLRLVRDRVDVISLVPRDRVATVTGRNVVVDLDGVTGAIFELLDPFGVLRLTE